MRVNEQIVELLKKHPEGGEKFFDALDLMIRSDISILDSFTHFIENDLVNSDKISVILTGHFGRAFVNFKYDWLRNNFSDFVLVNGGIRSGANVEIDRLPDKYNCVFIDDSFYSGTTRDKIMEALGHNYECMYSYVIYDGSKHYGIQSNVYSMFRYYEKDALGLII